MNNKFVHYRITKKIKMNLKAIDPSSELLHNLKVYKCLFQRISYVKLLMDYNESLKKMLLVKINNHSKF